MFAREKKKRVRIVGRYSGPLGFFCIFWCSVMVCCFLQLYLMFCPKLLSKSVSFIYM